jgi:hypothetical protein
MEKIVSFEQRELRGRNADGRSRAAHNGGFPRVYQDDPPSTVRL